MSDEKKYTERDLVLAKREAFCAGRGAAFVHYDIGAPQGKAWPGSAHLAAERYPLPKVTRPRVVTREDGCQLRISGGQLQYKWLDGDWREYGSINWTPAQRAAMADLLANPTEEVDA